VLAVRGSFGFEKVIVSDVRDSHDKHSHPASRTMNDTGRNVNERSLGYILFLIVQNDGSRSLKHVVKLRRSFMVVQTSSIDVHSMHPGCRIQVCVFTADQAISPPAGASFPWCVAFMSNEQRA
jgi:hypothetical protein